MQRLAQLSDHVDMTWPPMAHVRRGEAHLTPEHRALVLKRLEHALAHARRKRFALHLSEDAREDAARAVALRERHDRSPSGSVTAASRSYKNPRLSAGVRLVFGGS